MLAAVQFDDNRRLKTNEVANVATDLMLASELEAVQLTSAQIVPEATFGFGGVLAKMAGVVVHAPRTSLPRGATMTYQQPQVAF
jgi:hypothetical protein